MGSIIKRRANVLLRRCFIPKMDLVGGRLYGKRPKHFSISEDKIPRISKTIVPGGIDISEWYNGGYSDYLWKK